MQTRSQGKDQRPEPYSHPECQSPQWRAQRTLLPATGSSKQGIPTCEGPGGMEPPGSICLQREEREEKSWGGGGGEHTSKPSNLHEGIGFNYSLP